MKTQRKFFHLVFLTFLVLTTFQARALDLQPGQDFAFEEIDYTEAPIYKQIKKHPENYTYLDSVTIYRILYRSEGLKITGLMAAPKKDGKFPVVIFNRGGNREFGALKVSTATDILAPIASHDYVVVASNYRGNSGSEGAEEFGGADVTDVVSLAKTCSGFKPADNSKIALLGVSRGGMMSYLVLRKMREYDLNVSCAIVIGGITDLEKTIAHHAEIGLVCEEIVPNYSSEKAGCLLERSAIYWVQELPVQCPLLILHSYDDASVSYEQIPPFLDSLDTYQIPYKHLAYKQDNHGIANHREHVQDQINSWLNQFLKEQNPDIPVSKREIIE